MKIILIVLACLILLLIAVITVFALKNVSEMNACVDETIAKISEGHKLTPVEPGEYAQMSAYGILKFHVRQYEIEDLGNLSVMTVNAGVMQMATIVFSPFEKDLPLMSCDYMYMLSTRKAYVELYDLVEEKDETYMAQMDLFGEVRDKYADLKDTSASPGWYDDLLTVAIYKATGPSDDKNIRALLGDAVGRYLEMADDYPLLDDEAKTAKAERIKNYSDRLIDEGGVSTSFFKSALGEDVTRDFFDRVFFGTECFR